MLAVGGDKVQDGVRHTVRTSADEKPDNLREIFDIVVDRFEFVDRCVSGGKGLEVGNELFRAESFVHKLHA